MSSWGKITACGGRKNVWECHYVAFRLMRFSDSDRIADGAIARLR